MASISHWGMFALDRFPPHWEVRWSQQQHGWILQWLPAAFLPDAVYRREQDITPVRTPSICEGRPL